MNLDVLMWLIVLFGGLFVLVGLASLLFKLGNKLDKFLSRMPTAPWADNILLKSFFFIPVALYCYFWYNAAMSLASQI